jgi:putative peptidoglycan lipid II flippase
MPMELPSRPDPLAPTATAAAEPADGGRPSLALAAAIVAAGFLGSRLLGLVRSAAIADAFGTSPELDAFWVAFRLPDLIFQLLAGAAMGAAFIPVFTRLYNREAEERAWRMASSVLNLVAIATIAFAVLGALLAPLLVPIMAPGLGEDVGREEELRSLAVELTRWMMLSPVFFAVSGMATGILNARHRFLFPAIAPMVYNLAIIVGALVSESVRGLTAAVVIGAGLHLMVQIPGLVIAGIRYWPTAEWRDAAVREVARLMGPRVLGLAAFHLNFIVTLFFASTVSDGAISAINYAWLIMLTPLGLFAMAISTAVFPTLAEQALGDRSLLKQTLERSLRLILFLTVPSAIGLMILSEPLIAFFLENGVGIFGSGAFDEASTELTAPPLLFYAIGLPAHAAIEILSRGFYSVGDTRTPVAFAIASLVINVVLSVILVGPLELRGLALSLSVATIVEAALLFWTLHLRLDGLDLAALRRSTFNTAASAILMAEVIGFYLILLHQAGHLTTSLADSAIAVAGSALLGGAIYFATAQALRSEEMELLMERIPRPPRPA